ncbi:HPr family phosphocarrier protein [Paenibacillus sp. GCM10023252]|uniref:HPr family phosphocarrier protein n=1 Tax=Paenibacillus sp. GCM10023252 TaxID=3252649 RepID=UPI00360E190C
MRVHEFRIAADLEREELIAISVKASRFISDIILSFTYNDSDHTVDVKSLLGILLLPIKAGSIVCLRTRGRDELEALEYVLGLFAAKEGG